MVSAEQEEEQCGLSRLRGLVLAADGKCTIGLAFLFFSMAGKSCLIGTVFWISSLTACSTLIAAICQGKVLGIATFNPLDSFNALDSFAGAAFFETGLLPTMFYGSAAVTELGDLTAQALRHV